MILEFRMSAEDGVEGGMTIDDMVEFCKEIDGMVDIIHISNGLEIKHRPSLISLMYMELTWNMQQK